MNSKKASRSRGVRTWPVVVLRRRVLGGCACAGDRVLRGDGRGLVWLRVQVQVLGPLRGGEVGGGRCEEKDARGKRGRAPTLRGGESRTESRETHESGGGRRLLLRKTSRDAYLQKNRSERGLRGAGERCRRHRAGRSCRVGRTSHESPQNISKYLFCVVPEHASRCPTKSSSPWSADRVFHRTSLDGASSEAPRSAAGVVLSETTPWTKR